jgi:hypothetical protein
MFERLALLAERRGRRVVIAAVVVSIAAGALGAGVADRLDPYGADDPATESVKGADRLEGAGYRETGVVVLVDGVDVDSAAGRDRIEALTEELGADEDVAAVASFYTTGSRDFVSRDGASTYLAVQLSPTEDDEIQDAGERISSALQDEPGVAVGGGAVAQQQANEQVEQDLRTAELYAFPLLFLLSLLFFRSLVAAALPLLVGGLTIVGDIHKPTRQVDRAAEVVASARENRAQRQARPGGGEVARGASIHELDRALSSPFGRGEDQHCLVTDELHHSAAGLGDDVGREPLETAEQPPKVVRLHRIARAGEVDEVNETDGQRRLPAWLQGGAAP